MKIRNGFVSNSSSSSFVLITTKENHEKTMEEITDYAKKVIEAMEKETIEAFGKELICFKTYNDMSGCSSFDDLDIDFEGEKPEEYEEEGDYLAFEQYKEKVLKNKDTLTLNIDF